MHAPCRILPHPPSHPSLLHTLSRRLPTGRPQTLLFVSRKTAWVWKQQVVSRSRSASCACPSLSHPASQHHDLPASALTDSLFHSAEAHRLSGGQKSWEEDGDNKVSYVCTFEILITLRHPLAPIADLLTALRPRHVITISDQLPVQSIAVILVEDDGCRGKGELPFILLPSVLHEMNCLITCGTEVRLHSPVRESKSIFKPIFQLRSKIQIPSKGFR